MASLGFPQVRVNDGEWHHLLVELRSVKDGKDIKYVAAVSLDYGMYKVRANDITNRRGCGSSAQEEMFSFSIVCFKAEVGGDR